MIELSLEQVWARLGHPQDALGGGSAAALALGTAAALVAKAARRSISSWPEAAGAAAQARCFQARCSQLAEFDARAFAAALRALERRTDVQLHVAETLVPLMRLGETAADVAELAAETAERCDGTFRADAVSAALLAEAAAQSAAALVAANLTVLKDDEHLRRARRFAELARAAARRAAEAGP